MIQVEVETNLGVHRSGASETSARSLRSLCEQFGVFLGSRLADHRRTLDVRAVSR